MNNSPDNRQKYKYLFGPVPSRRLGLSLGIDLVTPKTCSYDCLFCEVGRTTAMTVERKEYVPAGDILAEFADWHGRGGNADYITLAGSGEPTLHSRFGFIIKELRRMSSIKTALFTNGSMLHMPDVRRDAAFADVAKVSLSAWDDRSYGLINRPHPALGFEDVVLGIGAFRSEFKGELWLEVFVLAGVNDNERDIGRIAAITKGFHADKIHLNTVARPPADKSAVAVDGARLKKLAELFSPEAEVIAGFASGIKCARAISDAEVLAMIARRPCTARDVADAFGVETEATQETLNGMLQNGQVTSERRGKDVYFLVAPTSR
ncbi:MAG: radical SAM protein [Verrucomicrobia bacterium]|nr:radical SAM protein [Verrucomicrobiota bacterium]